MNAIRKMMPAKNIDKATVSKTNLSLISNEKYEDKKEAEKMTKEYLNEKLSYFYSHGGPIMDI